MTAQLDEAPAPRDGAPWGLFDAIGYGGLGFGLGAIAGTRMSGDDLGPSAAALVTIAGMTAASTWAGAVIGGRAARTLACGQPLGTGHRRAVVAGVVMAGATLGALAAVPLIAPGQAGTPLGTDEQTLALLASGSAVLGSLYMWKNRDRLAAWSVGLAPRVRESGRPSLHLSVRF